MERLEGYITEDYGDGSVQSMMFTYSEGEREQNIITKNNSELIFKPEYFTIDYKMLHGGFLWYECVIYSFIKFFLSNNERFYFTNEQLSKMLLVSERSIINAISHLQGTGLIKCKYRIKAGGGKIRFVELQKNTFSKSNNCLSDKQQLLDINNKIIKNKISNSNELDNISSPQEKKFIPIKQKTNIAVVEENPLPGPLPEVAGEFTKDSIEKFPSIQYQMNKDRNKYLMGLIKDYNKLIEEYGEETVKTVLRYIKQDEFWSKQIQSISKLRKKNRDGVPYMVVMMEKIQNWKPSNNIITL